MTTRSLQLVFTCFFAGLCWQGMQAVHEAGHVIGALSTGGVVERVVLHPISISRTDLSQNPRPGIVVWCGPLLGVLIPLAVARLFRQCVRLFTAAQFFAGFCLIANGAYISMGLFDQVGDCGEMLRTGTPAWVMLVFGAVTVSMGFVIWHRLGSVTTYFANPSWISGNMALTSCAAFTLITVLQIVLAQT